MKILGFLGKFYCEIPLRSYLELRNYAAKNVITPKVKFIINSCYTNYNVCTGSDWVREKGTDLRFSGGAKIFKNLCQFAPKGVKYLESDFFKHFYRLHLKNNFII